MISSGDNVPFFNDLSTAIPVEVGFPSADTQGMDTFLVPFAAGGFIYIAATDLMPELHKGNQAKESVIQLLALLTGIGLMSILKALLA